MRTHDSKVSLLRRIPFLQSCSHKELVELASQLDEVEVEAGRVLTREGAAGREAFIVIDGWAAVSCDGVAIAAIGPGEFIGEMAMLSHQPRSATVVAKTRMRLLVVSSATFRAVSEHRDVGRAMAVCLARRLRDVEV